MNKNRSLQELLVAQRAAQSALDVLNAEVEIALNTDEGRMIAELDKFDEQIEALQEQRLKVEIALLRYRFANNLQPHLSVREASLITGLQEMSIRTLANPKRARYIATVPNEEYKTIIIAASLKEYVNKKGLPLD